LDVGTLSASYAVGVLTLVTHDSTQRSSQPVRRPPASGERASSFGFDLEARRRLVARDPEQTARLFDVAFERIHGYIARMVRDEHVAEDLTSETFLRIQRGLATYRPEFALRPWLFTIASNVLRDHFAARREQAVDVHELAEDSREPEARVDAPEAGAVRDERARATAKALGELSEQARAVLILRHYQTLSFAEIGAALRISEDTARQRYARALARLRTRLADHAPSHGDPA